MVLKLDNFAKNPVSVDFGVNQTTGRDGGLGLEEHVPAGLELKYRGMTLHHTA